MNHRFVLIIFGVLAVNLVFGQDKKKPEDKFNRELIAILDTIHQEDQKYRIKSEELIKEYGWNSIEVQDIEKVIREKDSVNLIKVEKILLEKGWLGADVIGEQGNKTLFLVIQHSDHKTQLKYLPLMQDAVKKGNAQAKSLALLEDRISLGEGKRQIYGSQIGQDQETGEYYVFPIDNPENVNQRRLKVGLGTIEEYVKYWNITWDLKKHIQRTAQLEEKK